MNESVQVSIICTTYNHEKYIRKCLDGFVMQKDVTFEIIIHDDASTDNTANIIREYEKKYPALFKPIYQTENQHSKRVKFITQYMVPLISGRYVAFCEGDDYWTDPHKLKKQFDALENHPDCLMCAHIAREINEDGTDSGMNRPRIEIPTSVLPIGYVCNHFDDAKFIHTSSFFLNSRHYLEYKMNPPQFRQVSPAGDLPTLLYFSSFGCIYYINEVMSHYRFLSIGSYSYRNNNGPDHEKRMRNIMRKMRDMLAGYCEFINEKKLDFSQEQIKKDIAKYDLNEYWYCIDHNEYKSLFKEFRIKELKELGLGRKAMLKMKLQMWFPKAFKNKQHNTKNNNI